MFYLLLITYIICLLINKVVFNKRMKYVNIIISIWFLIAVLLSGNFYNMRELNSEIYNYIFQFIITFELASVFFYKFVKVKEKNVKYVPNDSLITFILLMCIIINIPYLMRGINVLMVKSSFSSLRNAYLNYELCSNAMYMLQSLIIFPLGEAIGYYVIPQCIDQKKINKNFILFLLFIFEIILFTGGRARIIYYMLLGLIVLFENSKNIFSIMFKNKKIVILLLLAVIGIISITNQRNLANGGFIYNIYVYLTGGMRLLSVYISSPEKFLLASSELFHGGVLFSGISYPFIYVLNLFGSDLTAGYYVVNKVTSLYLPIGNNTLINNGGAFIYYALRDFGSIGPFIYTILFSLLGVIVYKNRVINSNYFTRAIYYFIIIKMIFLYNEFSFAYTSVIMTVIYIWLLRKKVKSDN